MSKAVFNIILSCIICQCIYAQNFPFRHYTTTDGLINASVFVAYQDHNGFMWFGTENGVSKFDGNTFKNYTVADGLSGDVITGITEDDKHHIYIGAKSQGVTQIVNDSISKIYTDSSGHLFNEYIAVINNKFYSLSPYKLLCSVELKTHQIKYYKLPAKVKFQLFKKFNDKSLLVGTSCGLYELANDSLTKIHIAGLDTDAVHSISIVKDTLFLGAKDGIVKVFHNKIIQVLKIHSKLPENIFDLLVDSRGYIWYSTQFSSKIVCIRKDTSIDITNYLGIANTDIGRLSQDNDGNIWITTFNDGVFCVSNFYLNIWKGTSMFKDNYITTLSMIDKDNLFVGTNNGAYCVNILSQDSKPLFETPSFYSFYHISGSSIEHHSGTLFISYSIPFETLYGYVHKNVNNMKLLFFNHSCVIGIDDSTCICGGWHGDVTIERFKSQSKSNVIQNIPVFPRSTSIKIKCLYKDRKGNIWVGTAKGVAVITSNGKVIHEMDCKDFSVNQIIEDKKEGLWFCTDHGLVIYEDNKWHIVSKIDGASISGVTSLAFDESGGTWIGTLNGLFVLRNGAIKKLDFNNGLPSNQINAMLYDTHIKQLVIGTAKGVGVLDVSAYNRIIYKAPPVIITEVTTPLKKYILFNNLQFTSSERTINVTFTAISLSLSHQLEFQYSLDDAGWVNVQSGIRSIQFVDMNYGNHKLLLRCSLGNSVWSQLTPLNFIIHTPYWATLWFMITIIVLSLLIVVSIAWWRVNVIRRNARERLNVSDRINELRHQALAASMNPHFVFNSLNSIQHFINAREPHEASDYLGRFARLIRQTVNLSTETHITLEEEITRLKGYLDLEQLRLGDMLTYEVIIDDNIELKNIQIPNMVIQPFVENAIWHGIMPAKRAGQLTITVAEENNNIKIEIKDNGVGYSKSPKKSNHISKGMQIVSERLKTVNDNGTQAIVIEDLSESTPPEQGTRVTIRFMKVLAVRKDIPKN